MKFNLNPGFTNIEIPFGGITVVLVLRKSTAEEYSKFLQERFQFAAGGELSLDQSPLARMNFIDQLLIDIKVKDQEGNLVEPFFTDCESGEEKPLTPEVQGWKNYVEPSFKCAAAVVYEGVIGKIESVTLKN